MVLDPSTEEIQMQAFETILIQMGFDKVPFEKSFPTFNKDGITVVINPEEKEFLINRKVDIFGKSAFIEFDDSITVDFQTQIEFYIDAIERMVLSV